MDDLGTELFYASSYTSGDVVWRREATVGRRVATAGLTAVAVVATVAGCSKSTSQTSAPTTTDTAAATAALWDPCSQIGDEVLQKLGVDPSTKEAGIGGGVQAPPGWKGCTWHDTPNWGFSITVWSSNLTIQDVKKKPGNIDFTNVTVADRDGMQYRTASNTSQDSCHVNFPSTQGFFEISILNVDPQEQSSPCDHAISAANIIVPNLPK